MPGMDRARCLGIGLGPVRPLDGALAPDLVDHLRTATRWPVLVENDPTAAAAGEFWVARRDRPLVRRALVRGRRHRLGDRRRRPERQLADVEVEPEPPSHLATQFRRGGGAHRDESRLREHPL